MYILYIIFSTALVTSQAPASVTFQAPVDG